MAKKNDDLVVFILTYGRSKKVYTYDTIKRQGYTGKIYLVCSDDDKEVEDYKKNFPNEVVVSIYVPNCDKVFAPVHPSKGL